MESWFAVINMPGEPVALYHPQSKLKLHQRRKSCISLWVDPGSVCYMLIFSGPDHARNTVTGGVQLPSQSSAMGFPDKLLH